MDMLEKSQDQQRQDLEQALVAKGGQVRDVRPSSPSVSSRKEPVTSRLRHVRDLGDISGRLHRGTQKASKTHIHK